MSINQPALILFILLRNPIELHSMMIGTLNHHILSIIMPKHPLQNGPQQRPAILHLKRDVLLDLTCRDIGDIEDVEFAGLAGLGDAPHFEIVDVREFTLDEPFLPAAVVREVLLRNYFAGRRLELFLPLVVGLGLE